MWGKKERNQNENVISTLAVSLSKVTCSGSVGPGSGPRPDVRLRQRQKNVQKCRKIHFDLGVIKNFTVSTSTSPKKEVNQRQRQSQPISDGVDQQRPHVSSCGNCALPRWKPGRKWTKGVPDPRGRVLSPQETGGGENPTWRQTEAASVDLRLRSSRKQISEQDAGASRRRCFRVRLVGPGRDEGEACSPQAPPLLSGRS